MSEKPNGSTLTDFTILERVEMEEAVSLLLICYDKTQNCGLVRSRFVLVWVMKVQAAIEYASGWCFLAISYTRSLYLLYIIFQVFS